MLLIYQRIVATLPFIEAEIQDIYIKYINMKQIFNIVKKNKKYNINKKLKIYKKLQIAKITKKLEK